jgi:basic amino acid/polyamine antiporter, APA family
MRNIWAKKSLHDLMGEAAGTTGELKRTLSRFNLIMLGIGAVIGAGIFVLTGQAAATYAGPAIVVSFIVAGAACGFAGLCYAEFASMIPLAGSAYTYAYATLGEFIAWIIGWDLILEYLFAGSTVAVGWSGYMVSLLNDFGVHIPAALSSAPFDYDIIAEKWVLTGSFLNLPAMFIIAVTVSFLVLGIKESANFNNIIVLIKLIVIFLFVSFGAFYIMPENLEPFVPANTGHFGQFGWSGVLRASGVIFFAFIGFDAVSTLAQEVKNPQRDMPWGILGSLAICTLVYVLVGFVMTGMVSYTSLNTAAPIAVAVDSTGTDLQWLRTPIKLGAIAGLSSVVLVQLLGQTRIFYAMSSDGLIPRSFAKVHPKLKTPYISTLITGFFAFVISGLFPIGLLGELVSIGTLLAFAIVSAGVLVLRYKSPEIPRPFKTPWFPFVPIMGILTSVGVMSTLPGNTWVRLALWMIAGLVIYFFYGMRKSKLNNS